MNGRASATSWESVRGAAAEVLHTWWRSVSSAGIVRASDRSVGLADLLLSCVNQKGAGGLFLQVAHAVAKRVEGNVLVAGQRGRQTRFGITATTNDLLAILDDRTRLDYELLRRVLACREATRSESSFSWACDKANVGGVSLHNSILVLHSNVAMVLPPQVDFGVLLGAPGVYGRRAGQQGLGSVDPLIFWAVWCIGKSS